MAQSFNFTGDPKVHDPSEFSNGLTGTCLCGSISVTIHDPELFTRRRGHLCHCYNCRKCSGSYVAANFAVAKSAIEIKDERGTMKTYNDYATGSGKKLVRSFCGVDGNPICSETELYPGTVIMKMGIFPRIPTPEMETFVQHKHDWQGEHEGTIQFETMRGGKKVGE